MDDTPGRAFVTAPNMDESNSHSQEVIPSPKSLISALVSYLESVTDEIKELHVPEAILEQLTSAFLSPKSAKEPLTRQLIQKVVQVLDSNNGAFCERLGAKSFGVLIKLLLKAEDCLATERGLCLLLESLARGSDQKSNKVLTKFSQKKTHIGALVLQQLVGHFTDTTVPSQLRRWTGFLLCELLKDSEENGERFETSPIDLQKSIGRIVVEAGNANLRVIAGAIVGQQKLFGSSEDLYWPPTFDKENLKYFPEVAIDSSQWMAGFQSFLNKGGSRDSQTASGFPESIALQIKIDNELLLAPGNISVAAERNLALLIPPLNGSPVQFLDISFEKVQSILSRDFQQDEMPEELVSEEFTDVVLNLGSPNGSTYTHNAVQKAASQIIVTLYSVSDAEKLVEHVENERKLRKSKTTIKVSDSMRASNSSLSYIGLVEKGGERLSGVDPGSFGDISNEILGDTSTVAPQAEGSSEEVANTAKNSSKDANIQMVMSDQNDHKMQESSNKVQTPGGILGFELSGDDLYGQSPESNWIQEAPLAFNLQANTYRAPARSNPVKKMLDVSDLLDSPPVRPKMSIKNRLRAKDGRRPSKETVDVRDTEAAGSDDGKGSASTGQLPTALAKKAFMDAAKLAAGSSSKGNTTIDYDDSISTDIGMDVQFTTKVSTPGKKNSSAVTPATVKAPPKKPADVQRKNQVTNSRPPIPSKAQQRVNGPTDWSEAANGGDEDGESNHGIVKKGQPLKSVKGLKQMKAKTTTAKLAIAKTPAKGSGGTHPKKPSTKDIPAFPKKAGKMGDKPIDWDEAFHENDNGEPGEGRTIKPKANAKATVQAKAATKLHKTVSWKGSASSKKPEPKPVKQAAKTERKPAPGALPPPRSVRAAAADARRKIAMVQDSPGDGKAAGILENDTKKLSSHEHLSDDVLMANGPPEAAAPVGSDPEILPTLEVKNIAPPKGLLAGGELVTNSKPDKVLSPEAKSGIGPRVDSGHINLDLKVFSVRTVTHQQSPSFSNPVPQASKDGVAYQLVSNKASLLVSPAKSTSTSRLVAQDAEKDRVSLSHTEVGSPLHGLHEDLNGQNKPSKGPHSLAMVKKLRSALSMIEDSLVKSPARSDGQTKRARGAGEEPESDGEFEFVLKKIKTENSALTPNKTARSNPNNASRSTNTDAPTNAKSGVNSIYGGPTNCIILSSDSSDNESYYSDGSSLSASPVIAKVQTSNKTEEVGQCGPSSLSHRRITPAKALGTALRNSISRANVTPAGTRQHHPTLLDDSLLSRSKVVSWSATGPRNQGRIVHRPPLIGGNELPAEEKQVAQASPIPKKRLTKVDFVVLDKRKPSTDKGKPPMRSVTPMTAKGRGPAVFVPLTDEDIVLNAGDSRSPSLVEFSQKPSSQRTRVEEGGSPIAITRFHSQDDRQAKSLRDVVAGSSASKTMHDLEEEFRMEDRRLADLALVDASPPGVPRTVFSSIHKHGPRSPSAASGIEFVASETMQIIRPAKPQPDPFTSMGPRRNSSFMQKLQANTVKTQSPAKRKLATEKDEPSKRASVSKGLATEPTKAIERILSNTSLTRTRKSMAERSYRKASQKKDPDRTLVNIDSDPDVQSSPSSSSSSSSESSDYPDESSESDNHQDSWETDPEKFWRESLKPHQSNILEVLYQISNDLVRHLADQEICIDDIVYDYQRGGTKLLKELEESHQGDCEEFQVKVQNMKLALSSLYGKAKYRIAGGIKQQQEQGMKTVEREWRDGQEALLKQMKTALTLVNA